VLYIIALALGLFTGLTNGGSLYGLASLRLKFAWLILIALIVQLVIFSPLRPPMPGYVLPILHMISLVMALVVALLNLPLPGMQLMVLGLILNLSVTAANGGLMPASIEGYLYLGDAERAATLRTQGSINNVTALTPESRLPILADIIPLPFPLPRPALYSLGDMAIFLGLFTLAMEGTKARARS
jgi:hypothetical protein